MVYTISLSIRLQKRDSKIGVKVQDFCFYDMKKNNREFTQNKGIEKKLILMHHKWIN